jgi:hypothetical protein
MMLIGSISWEFGAVGGFCLGLLLTVLDRVWHAGGWKSATDRKLNEIIEKFDTHTSRVEAHWRTQQNETIDLFRELRNHGERIVALEQWRVHQDRPRQ